MKLVAVKWQRTVVQEWSAVMSLDAVMPVHQGPVFDVEQQLPMLEDHGAPDSAKVTSRQVVTVLLEDSGTES